MCNAGGVGAMGLTWLDPQIAVDQVKQVKDSTDKPFLVNFVLHFEPIGLEAVLREGVPIVTFSWGATERYRELGKAVKASGAQVGVQVCNRQAASLVADAADFLICQGIEAGGHVQSSTPLRQLLKEIHDLPLPIVAAGGLSTGQHIHEVRRLGATAAMLGTRFVATEESRAHDSYKQMLLDSNQTALTGCFDGGWPHALHRVLKNSTFTDWEAAGSPAPPHRPNEGRLTARRGEALIYQYDDAAPQIGAEGDIEAMCLYAGTGVDEIKDIPSAAELVSRLLKELSR